MGSCSSAATDSDGVAISLLPDWILLDMVGYIDGDGEGQNSTTAEARTSSWQSEAVKVSFFAADPPRLSRFGIQIPGGALHGRPTILQSVDNLALIEVSFASGYRAETEYYVYRAGVRGQRPSLDHLRYISCNLKEVPGVASVGILPNNDDAGFALVALALTAVEGQYGLHVFRAEQGTWTSKVHLLKRHQLANLQLSSIEKVIVLGGGEIGFVDLWNGILAFKVLQDTPMPRFIPLPLLLPGNQSDNQLGYSARLFRDVNLSSDGSIKCVEVEACWQRILHERPHNNEAPLDVWDNDTLYDLEFIPHHTEDKDDTENATYEYLGWRVKAWSRDLSSSCWRKVFALNAKDIINDPIHNALSSELPAELQLKSSSVRTSTVKDLFISFPTLSMDGNTLYVVSKFNVTQQELRVLAVDMQNRSLKGFSPILTQRHDFYKSTYIGCDLFKRQDVDSDGTQIGSDDAYFLTSLEPAEETGGMSLIRPSKHYPPPEYYKCSTFPCFCHPESQSKQPPQLSGSTYQECSDLRFGTIAFDDKYSKEAEAFTAGGLLSIVFEGAAPIEMGAGTTKFV